MGELRHVLATWLIGWAVRIHPQGAYSVMRMIVQGVERKDG